MSTLATSSMSLFTSQASALPVCGIFYDMGETALKESFYKLREEKIPFKILLFGAALASYLSSPTKLGFSAEEVLLPESMGLQRSTLPQSQWHYNQALSEGELLQVAFKVQALNPSVILSGSVSEIQSQLLSSIKAPVKGVYYDNVKTLPSDNERREVIQRCFQSATHLLVPSKPIAQACFSFSPREIHVVGHPEIDALPKLIEAIDTVALKNKLDIPSDRLVMTYIGGYDQGESTRYKRSFQAFIDLLQGLCSSTLEKLTLIISLHPRQVAFKDSQLPEYFLLQQNPLPSSVQLFISGGEGRLSLSTVQAVALSHLHLSFGSSVTTQAVFAGKPGVFYFPLQDSFQGGGEDLMVQKGVVAQIVSSKELEAHLQQSLPTTSPIQQENPYQKAGIPMDSTFILYDWLKDQLVAVKNNL